MSLEDSAAPWAKSAWMTRRLWQVLRSRLSEHPALYLPLARRRYPGPEPEVISADTELVIDGYTRSASTFAVCAFQLAQKRPVRVAHHLHAPAHIIAAVKRGVPALVLIRDPEGAILSQLVREPYIHLRDALMAYARFYSCLLPYRSRYVVGEFEEVRRDFGAVIRQLNRHFGTSFAEFVPSDANMRECFDLIRERPARSSILLGFESGLVTLENLRKARHNPIYKANATRSDAWVPSEARTRAKMLLREQWLQVDLAKLRNRAELVYKEFLGNALSRR
jgi:hypothetical protein